jgi:signal peptidase I
VTEDTQALRPRRKRRSGLVRFLRDVAIILVAAVVISFLIKTFLIRSFYIPSESME